MMRLFLRSYAALFVATIIGAAVADARNVRAATLTVTSTSDSGMGSLRDAIAAASDGTTIQFDAALNGQIITLTSDELVIDKSINISGPGPGLLTVERAQTAPNFSIFHILPGHVVMIQGLTIRRGYPTGGGILNDQSMLTVVNCTVSDNFGSNGALGGGIASFGANASLTITDSTISRNVSDYGGGIFNEQGPMTITNSTISSNHAVIAGSPIAIGGGIVNGGKLEISHSTISGNAAGVSAGGIINGGALTITDSTVSNNESGSELDFSGRGGGIYNARSLTIRNSTISGNHASGKNFGTGGGILNFGDDATVAISNSTVSGNFSNRDGGGIYNSGAGATVEVTNSTLSGNFCTRDGGGIYNSAGVEMGDSILDAGTSGANIFNNAGVVTSHGYNLSSDNGGGFLSATGDQISTDPLLGPLQNNGGPALTHALLPGSPAINAGDPGFTPPPLYDQRGPGYDRVFSGRIDIGSLEIQPPPTPSPTPTPSATPTPTPTPVPSPAQALNISTRLRVETGNNVLIGGFIITGSAPKTVAVRGIGPSLAASGISDALSDPTLELRAANGSLIVQNDNWQDNAAYAAQLTALGLALQDSRESGVVATLAPSASYTTIMAGKNGSTGVGLMEIYDSNQGADSQLANISTRGFVQTGSNVMIGGFILGGGSTNTQVAVRGIGPSLAQFGLSPLLVDPTLELHDGNGTLLIANDDWQSDSVSAGQLSAHGLALQDMKESGIFTSLPPGAFTAILAGNNGGLGIGLVEIYNVR